MSQDKNQEDSGPAASPDRRADAKSGERRSPDGTGVGDLFRDEREKKGLSYVQISEITRLRPNILEALENEDWKSLPSPVFVRGFVRSYAGVLGLQEEKMVSLYQKVAPAEITPPKPLMEPTKTRRNVSLFLTFLLIAIVSGYYVRKEYPSREEALRGPETITSMDVKVTKSEDIQKVPNETEPLPLNQQGVMNLVPEADSEPEMEAPNDLLVEGEPPFPMEEILSIEPESEPEVERTERILKVTVREVTWIRIFVDDQYPKEYIFRPGSQPEWRAKEGFELLIGNAGGIGLELDGERIENLGDVGQVVRLRLPENYERRNSQD